MGIAFIAYYYYSAQKIPALGYAPSREVSKQVMDKRRFTGVSIPSRPANSNGVQLGN